MEKIYSNQKERRGSGGSGRYIEIPCSERDIMYLQQICMIPGVHTIAVPSLASGRNLLIEIIAALAWHQDVGYLGVEEFSTTKYPITNITQAFEWPLDQEKLEEFFIDSFYNDLIWIEHTTQLFSMPWIETFEQQLLAYKLDTMIPIIIIEKI